MRQPRNMQKEAESKTPIRFGKFFAVVKVVSRSTKISIQSREREASDEIYSDSHQIKENKFFKLHVVDWSKASNMRGVFPIEGS